MLQRQSASVRDINHDGSELLMLEVSAQQHSYRIEAPMKTTELVSEAPLWRWLWITTWTLKC